MRPFVRRGAKVARYVVVTVVLSSAATAAGAPIWVKPQRGERIPVVDGDHRVTATEYEYSPGRRLFLNNWQRDVEAAWNSEAFIQIQDPGAAAAPGRMFIAIKVPRRVHPNQEYDTGDLTIFIRPDVNDTWNCATVRDRRIELAYFQRESSAPVEWRRAWEKQGDSPQGCGYSTLLNSDLSQHSNGYVKRIGIGVQDDRFLTIEVELALPAVAFTNKQIKLGLIHVDYDYLNEFRVLTIPNTYEASLHNQSLRWDYPSAWQALDLGEAVGTEMGFSAYNVGQMLDLGFSLDQMTPPALSALVKGNGGRGQPKEIAEAIWTRDHVCLCEVMEQDNRDAIVELTNAKRKEGGRREFEVTQPPPGKWGTITVANPPNNMILTSWKIIAKDSVRYTTLGCEGDDDNLLGSTRGAKGIVWARIAKPVCENGSDIGPDGTCGEQTEPIGSPVEWVDVFCTHTQAAYDTSNEYEHEHASVRGCQFDKLKAYMDAKRAPGGGLDRPAVLLGDLNTLGPRSLADNWAGDALNNWSTTTASWPDFPGHGNTNQLIGDYLSLRMKVGNDKRTAWDATNDDWIDGYDLTANTGGHGSWIGNYTEANKPKGSTEGTSALECTPSYPNLADFGRLDYIMLIPPATTAWPTVNFKWSPAHPAQAFVDKHFIDFSGVGFTLPGQGGGPLGMFSQDGCLSDHAEVVAYINLVATGEEPAFNPNKKHVLRYRVSRLYDVNNADDSWLGNEHTDWFTDSMTMSDGGTASDSFNDDTTPDGRDVDPRWSILSTPVTSPNTFVQTDLQVNDSDFPSGNDTYDGSPVASCLHPRFRLFHTFDNLNASAGVSPTVWLTDCNGVLNKKHGSFTSQNAKNPMDGVSRTYETRGNGDDGENDVLVRHVFRWCEVASDPICAVP